jgi:predicted regulator of Ras-like GTPase activity (Roadblock/LC7/MglB family)
MGLQGSLRDMSVADIIQVNCQDKKTASATLISNEKQAIIYFKDGAVVHAIADETTGEEVIYKVLSWDEGEFVLDVGVESPAVTIKRNWSGLLLEGAKRLDELSQHGFSENLLISKETSDSGEKLNDILNHFISAYPSVELAAIVGIDGYVKAGAYKENIEESLLGGVAAAAFNFGKRALGLLKMDQFSFTLIKGESYSVYVSVVNIYTVAVVITDNSEDLKMDHLNKLSRAVAPLA